jgi:hypothetical protein
VFESWWARPPWPYGAMDRMLCVGDGPILTCSDRLKVYPLGISRLGGEPGEEGVLSVENWAEIRRLPWRASRT